MLVPMTKIHIIGHRAALDATLQCLQRLQAVHLLDVTRDATVHLPPLSVDEAHRREMEELRYLRARIDATLALAPHPPSTEPAGLHETLDLGRLRRELEDARPAIEALVRRLDGLRAEEESFPRYISSLRKLLPLVPELTQLDGYETTALLIERRHRSILGDLVSALTELLGANFEVLSDQVDADTVGAVLVFPRHHAADVQSLLGHEQLTRVRLPARYENTPFTEAIVAMERHVAEIPGQIAALEDELDAIIRPRQDWARAAGNLTRRLEQLAARNVLGATTHTFVLSGWVPQARREPLLRALLQEVGEGVIVQDAPRTPDDNPPVLMHNPQPARSFEFLVRLLALPRYGSLDPTRLMMLFMPLFIGIMLGDVAYGLMLLGIAIFVYRKFRTRSPLLADLSRIFVMSSGWTIVWGVVYGEFLGDLGHRLVGIEPLWINREEALEPLLVFALALGGAHMVLALLLGIWESIRLGSRRTTVERIALLVALSGLFALAGVAAERLPTGLITPAVGGVLVSLVVLMAAGGALGILMGPLELLGAVGNVLSYLRIAAIGLASVFLAKVANELGAAAPLWLGLIVAALFHALNLALGAFSPTIQALRLHYVEFFGKFYEEGGEPFAAFGSDTPASPSPLTT